jgi:hypothetical protein
MLHDSRLTCHFAVALIAFFGTALWARSAGTMLARALGSTALGQSAPEGFIHHLGMFCSAADDGGSASLLKRSPLAWPPLEALTPSLPL